MITLNQIATMIKDHLSGGDSSIDVELDERDIIFYVRQKMNEILGLTFFKNMNMGDRNSLSAYIATYTDVAVSQDSEERNYYCELPENFIQLPHNKGIRRVSPKKAPSQTIYRSNNPYVSEHLPVGNMEGDPSYYHEGKKLIFRSSGWKRDWDKVTIKLIVAAPDSFGINEALPLYKDHVSEVIRESTQYFSNERIQDTINDGNKDIGVNTNG